MDESVQQDSSGPSTAPNRLMEIHTRNYQQELLEESKRRNIIIALDTGAGKTHIAILRIRYELEREHTKQKVCWFIAPNVALCTQQYNVIKSAALGTVAIVHGALRPEQWTNPQLWKSLVDTHRIIVSTPQVLLDALRHGYLSLEQIALLCFDEAHHCIASHPYNCIMVEYYHPRHKEGQPVPHILGLTASPMFGGKDVVRSFSTIEKNLDCTILTATRYRDELATYVNRPTFKQRTYKTVHPRGPLFSTNLAVMRHVVQGLSIDNDPYVVDLQRRLGSPESSDPESRARLHRKLSKAIQKRETYTEESLRRLVSAGEEILRTIGAWAADWYVNEAIEQVKVQARPFNNSIATFQSREKQYLVDLLSGIVTTPTSYYHYDISSDCQPKVDVLINCLLEEKQQAEELNEPYMGLVFVERRDCAFALTQVLKHHPQTKDTFRVGCLVGASESTYRRSLDITHGALRKDGNTLDQFRIGELNLIVATAVAEEGIDVQACGSVIRWDAPSTMVSFTQSRGRARRRHSAFTLLVGEDSPNAKDLAMWRELEQQMVKLYQRARDAPQRTIYDDGDDPDLDSLKKNVELRSSVTGALLSLASAASHLNHFCDVIPGASHYKVYKPLYEFDPPDLPEGWHALDPEERVDPPPQTGPFGCKVTLPRLLPPHLRVFTTPTEHRSKISAYRHVAFKAYKALYEEGLLNEHFLPLTSVIEPELEGDIRAMLQDVEARAGFSKVQVQMDPWTPFPDEEDIWWHSIVEIDNLPAIQLLTKVKPDPWDEDNGPVIFRPGQPPATMTLRVMSGIIPSEQPEFIEEATLYTRRLFFSVYGSRMDWNLRDFCYLLLPLGREDMEDDWIKDLVNALPEDATGEDACFVPLHSDESCFDFSEVDDIALVKKRGKLYQFEGWRMGDQITQEELEETQDRELLSDQALEFPVLLVSTLPPRSYFTIPLPDSNTSEAKPISTKLLVRDFTKAVLLSTGEVECALLLPTILRCVAISNTVKAFKESVLVGTGLEEIPNKFLNTSLLAPVAGERENYQRLETLGDTVLKFLVAVQLLDQYPLWHEGYLTRKKDHAVNNARLAKEAVRLELYKYIIRDRFIGKKWKPSYFSSSLPAPVQPQPQAEDEEGSQSSKKAKKIKTEQLSVKLLADVVESLIGAAYLHGSFELAFSAARLFGLGLKWDPLHDRLESIIARVEGADTRPSPNSLPDQIGHVETMIGYKFRLPELLLEAITHASHHPVNDFCGISYERMEFLGDAVLDMVVTDYLYHAPGLPSGKRYSPGHMHLRKSAMVNVHLLGYICLKQFYEVEIRRPRVLDETVKHSGIINETDTQRIWLYQCLLHSSSVIMEEQKDAFLRYDRGREVLEKSLRPSHFNSEDENEEVEGGIFPWGELTRLQAPKFLSDMIESILGAVYLDSRGDMNIVRGVLRKLGWWDILERMVKFHMDVLHPISRVSLWATINRKKEDGKSHHKPEYTVTERGGNVVCTLSIGDEVITEASERNQGKSSKEQVKFIAAEQAIKVLRIRGIRTK